MSILKVISYTKDFEDFLNNPDFDVVAILLMDKCFKYANISKNNFPVTLKRIYIEDFNNTVDEKFIKQEWNKLPFDCEIEILRKCFVFYLTIRNFALRFEN